MPTSTSRLHLADLPRSRLPRSRLPRARLLRPPVPATDEEVARDCLEWLGDVLPLVTAFAGAEMSMAALGRTAGTVLGPASARPSRMLVLDATWADEAERSLARDVAVQTSSELVELVCTLPRDQADDPIRATGSDMAAANLA